MQNLSVQSLIIEKEGSPSDPIGAGLVILDEQRDTTSSALNKLAAHRILSAPVKTAEGGYFMVDLVAISSSLLSDSDNGKEKLHALKPMCGRGVMLSSDGNSIRDALRLLADTGVRRILITTDDVPTNLVSQMDIIRYIMRHQELIPPKVSEVKAADIMTKDPICIRENERVSEVLKKIVRDSITGAAVIDECGRMEANFSLSDLRGLTMENANRMLGKTVAQFLRETQKFPKMPVTVSSSDDLYTILRLMFQNHIHRVHVVEDSSTPIGIITTTDVILCLHRLVERLIDE